MGQKVRLVVDEDLCMSTGSCVFAAPKDLELDGEGFPRALRELDGDDAALQDAAADCPTGALSLEPAEN